MKFKVWDKEKREFWAETFTLVELAESRRFPSDTGFHYDIIPIYNDQHWREFYANRFGTVPENIFYWYELTRKLQAAAQKDFSDLFIADCIYHVSEKRIVSRGLKARQDDTKEEIPF